jgi:aminopeptidase-like protein
MDAQAVTTGASLYSFAAELYPICRSITGDGVRKTLELIRRRVPLAIREVPSGSRVFDWEVPLEWNIEDAWIKDSDGRKVVDFQEHNLHVVSYSEPTRSRLSLAELESRVHSLPDHVDWIPYRTTYYRRSWGFCLKHRDRRNLLAGDYEVSVQSSLAKGALTYGELVLPGKSKREVLLFTHVCHPSLANDNTSGMTIAAELAVWLAAEPRRFTYRIVFAPGTIGSLCWLKQNEAKLDRVHGGLVLGLLGDPGALTYKQSRRGDTEIDRVVRYVLETEEPSARVIPFEPYGYDERQLCSPGFDLPVGRLTRSVNDGYPQYHSSADDLDLLSPQALERSLEICKRIIDVIERERRYVNLSPKGEPQLGKRGLYGAMGGRSPAERQYAMLWVLSQSDGGASLLDIARRSGVAFNGISRVADELAGAGLLRAVAPDVPKRVRAGAKKSARKRAAGKGSRKKGGR